jgi:hypothetical protein
MNKDTKYSLWEAKNCSRDALEHLLLTPFYTLVGLGYGVMGVVVQSWLTIEYLRDAVRNSKKED